MIAEIKATDKKIQNKLASVRKVPYLVLHDGYHYFEKHYGLKDLGALTDHSEFPMSIERMKSIRSVITQKNVQCIFTEPEIRSKFADTLIQEYHLKTAELNPLETINKQGHYNYNDMLNDLSESFLTCLSNGNQ